MPPQPLLTVALPTCNGARYVSEALRSILAQTGAEFELIISDDRSEDATLDLVRSLAGDRARIEVNSERLGLAGNWNRCVELARTPWVNIFHQDDLMRAGHLASHVDQITRFLSPGPGVCGARDWGMICGAAEAVDSDGRPVPSKVVERGHLDALPVDVTFPPGEFANELAVSNPVRCSAVTLQVSAHQRLGGFDPSYTYAVDWDFWVRLARSYAVRWLSRPTVDFRWHPASATHTFKRGTVDLDEQDRLLHNLFAEQEDRLPGRRWIRLMANRRLARAYLNRAYEASKAGDAPLARRCLARSLRLWPGIVGTIALDPRLAARLAIGIAAWRSKA